jgi:MinD superfamily P-loop ATPase
MSGGTTIAAGTYTIGVVKNGADDWTMALYKGGLQRGDEPDMANVIKLDSMYSSSEGNAEHMLIDITPGKGKFEGKAVLTLHFGTMFLAGALS